MEEQYSILIIDDEPVAREALESVLTNQGYNLIFANNGQEGLTKAVEILPDVVLLDIMMPEMNGFEVCQLMRQEPALAEVPIIMITALDDKKSRLQGLEAGADDFISKPFDRIELRTRLKSITRLNRYRNLLNERSKVAWIIDSAKDGYLLINQYSEILYSNKAARDYLSLSDPKSALGKNFLNQASIHYNLVPESAWQDWPSTKLKLCLVKPETENKSAAFLQVDSFSSTRSSELHWLVSIRDITTNTQLHNDVWKFHSAVSHKLRTPLTVIIGSLELLGLELEGQNAAIDLLNMAFNDIKRLYTNIEDVLQYTSTRNRSHKGEQFQLGDLPSILGELSKRLSLKPIAMYGYDEVFSIKLPLSKPTFTVILKELLENSYKFHPSQSPNIELTLSEDNNKITLEICDDGMYLSPEQLSQVWLPYYQAEKQLTGQVAGMGLGLSMVATIVWKVGGQWSIYNRADKVGLAVKLVFPIVKEI